MAWHALFPVARWHRLRRCAQAAVSLLALGCQPEIGDSCQNSTDCSAAGDRICDVTQPGGYCTAFNCEPDTCPEDESICVAFNMQRSLLPECRTTGDTRLLRTFCLKTCESESDCRPEYTCANLVTDNPWGAEIVESSSNPSRVCLLPVSGAPVENEPGVCTGPGDSGGAGGASGMGGSGTGGAGGAGEGGAGDGGGGAGEGGASSGGQAGTSGGAAG